MPVKIFHANSATEIDDLEKQINQWLMQFGTGDRMMDRIVSMSTTMASVAAGVSGNALRESITITFLYKGQ